MERHSIHLEKLKMNISGIGVKILTVLECLWALAVILNGNSVYHASAEIDLYLLELSVVLTYLVAIGNFVVYGFRPTRQNVMITLALMLYCTIYLSVMQEKMDAGTYVMLFVVGAPVLYLLFSELSRQGRLMKLLQRFGDWLCILAPISLFFWIFGVVLQWIQPNGYLRINWGAFDYIGGYYGIHYAFQYDTTFMPEALLYRNSGIFAEAPMFNLWLCIALGLEIFTRPKPRRWRIVLLSATILTTLSVTGMLFLVLCIVLTAFINYHRLGRIKKALLLLGALVAVPWVVTLLGETFSMKAETNSFDMRLSDYVGGVKLWMDYPLFGAGFGNLRAFVNYVYSPLGTIGFSNSVAAVLGTGGVWMASLYYIAHVGLLFPRITGSRKLSCFGVCMLFLFCTTIFFARYIGVLLVMLGLAIMLGPKNKWEV